MRQNEIVFELCCARDSGRDGTGMSNNFALAQRWDAMVRRFSQWQVPHSKCRELLLQITRRPAYLAALQCRGKNADVSMNKYVCSFTKQKKKKKKEKKGLLRKYCALKSAQYLSLSE